MMETIQDVLQLILQADDIKYVKNSGILNYGLDLKQVVEREIELSVCKGDKEILLAMNYDIEQCSVQFQIVDCTEEEEKKIIDLDFALNGAETAVDFTQALNLYLLSIGYIDEDNLEEYRRRVTVCPLISVSLSGKSSSMVTVTPPTISFTTSMALMFTIAKPSIL